MPRLHLPIQNPCHEDWDAMNETDGARRFCDSCAKHVHDVSAMTEREARTVLANESKRGRVCVRYTLDGRTGHIKYKVETVSAPMPLGFSSMFAAAGVALALLGGCTSSEPTRVEADGCVYEVGPWSFTAQRGEGTCPDVEPELMGDVMPIHDGQVIDVPMPDTAVAGGLGAEPIEMGEAPAIEEPPPPQPEHVKMGEAPAIEEPPQPQPEHVRMGKIAAPPSIEHVKMGDVGPVDEPCDDPPSQAGTTITPTPPPTSPDRPRRL